MCKKRDIAVLMVVFSGFLTGCSKGELNQSAAENQNNSNVIAQNTGDADKKSGGQITIIAGADKGLIKMRSTRFR